MKMNLGRAKLEVTKYEKKVKKNKSIRKIVKAKRVVALYSQVL